jgi:hypothetical protein
VVFGTDDDEPFGSVTNFTYNNVNNIIVIICSYNTIKTWIQGGNTKKPLGPTLHMVAAAQAGILTLVMTNPIWVVKTRLCLQYSEMDKARLPDSKRYLGMMDALNKIYYNEGIRGLYKVCVVLIQQTIPCYICNEELGEALSENF